MKTGSGGDPQDKGFRPGGGGDLLIPAGRLVGVSIDSLLFNNRVILGGKIANEPYRISHIL